MLSMHERRKSISSSSVIWYTILFRQNRTDRPSVESCPKYCSRMWSNIVLLRCFIRWLTNGFQAGASYQQRQNTREWVKTQHLISTVQAFLGEYAADKRSSQQRTRPLFAGPSRVVGTHLGEHRKPPLQDAHERMQWGKNDDRECCH